MSCNPERQAEYRAERGADSGVRGWVVVGGVSLEPGPSVLFVSRQSWGHLECFIRNSI